MKKINECTEDYKKWLIDKINNILTYSAHDKLISMNSRLILDLHIDSLEMLELITAVEQCTEKSINDDILLKWYQVKDILDYIVKIKCN
ncbi:acyl carrier protein [Providencia sneebia]|uniref:Carrier domain-containing protein n=1 Tax=Providencia sneebia DSM 19967 TaxID=1141660 RepID=K8WJY4_9GAMM|nr:hypothetical protein OO7_02401 [Providencia sneebia DSM 19967]